MRLYSLLFLAFIIISISANAQEPVPRIVPFTDFVSQEGFKGFEAVDIEIDPRGYVYITSNAGIFKFNGYDMTEDFIYAEGTEKAISYALHKDFNGDIWTGSRLGKIDHFKGDSISKYPVPDSILNMGIRGFESVYLDEDGLLHIAPRHHGHYTVDSKGKVTHLMSRRTTEIQGFVVQKLEDGSWFHSYVNSPSKSDSTLSVYYLNKKGELEEIVKTDCLRPRYESSLVEHSDGSLSLSLGTDRIVRFKGPELIEVTKFDFDIMKLFLDSRNDLWIGTVGQGAYQAKNCNLSNLTKYFEGNFAAVAESHDGGVWFKSDKIGLGYLPPKSGVHYSSQNGYDESITDIYFLDIVNSKVIFNTSEWKAYVLEEGKVEPLCPELNDFRVKSNAIAYDKAEDLYRVFTNNKIYGIQNKKIKSVIDLQKSDLADTRHIAFKNINGRILGCTPTNLFELKNNEIINLSDGYVTGRLNDFTMDDQGNFWFVSENGVKLLQGRSINELPFTVSDDLKTIFYACFYAEKYVWASSYTGDLVRFNAKGGEVVVDQNGKPCTAISYSLDENGILWGYDTNAGKIMKLSDLGNPDHVYRKDFIIPVNETGSIMTGGFRVYNDHLFVGSNLTLSVIPIDQLVKVPTPSKMDFRLFINYEPVPFANTYDLNYAENDIRLVFDAIGFSKRPVSFSYMLEGYETKWNETNNKELRYTNLNPGTYRLKLRSKVENSDWTEPEIITFEIKAPFWQTVVFKLLMVILGLLIFISLFILRVRNVRKKEQEKSHNLLEKTNLEMRALKSQLNPHFIFNSISSAMFYLSKNENDKAESYLQRFTKLMRGILENSDQEFVRLNDEVELMRHYVSLESEQYDGEPIVFDVSYSDIKPEEVKIPPTIVQPYIENSIRHGLKTKEGKRTISLSFRKQKENLEVTIIDNGIGREAAKNMNRRKSHKSFGMLISSRRITLLNEQNSSGAVVSDLHDSNGISTGTSVHFTIPLVNLEDNQHSNESLNAKKI